MEHLITNSSILNDNYFYSYTDDTFVMREIETGKTVKIIQFDIKGSYKYSFSTFSYYLPSMFNLNHGFFCYTASSEINIFYPY